MCKVEFTYRFEYQFSDTKNLCSIEKEDRLVESLMKFQTQTFWIECFHGGPAHYPYVKATSYSYEELIKFIGIVRMWMKGKRKVYFCED